MMKPHFRCILALGVLLLSARAFAQQSAPSAPSETAPNSFTVGEGDRVFNSASARATYLAVHFLLGARSESNAKYLKEAGAGLPTLAGVRHIFVQNASQEDFTATLDAAPKELRASLFRDADGKLGASLKLAATCTIDGKSVACPAVILFDPSGRETFRKISTRAEDRISFATLAARIAELTRDKETTEGNLSAGLALEGYDPVAYLDEQKAIAGDKNIRSSFRGVHYRFATTANRDRFNSSPAKYLPAYGGWCATAMAKGEKVEIDPKNFKITGGRLFLFYKGLFGNALNDWTKDEPGQTTKADAHWRKLVGDR